jgi:hypothetical protein
VQLNKGELGGSVDRDEQIELALFGANLGDVDVEVDLPPEEWTPGYADFASACSGVMYPMAEWIR